MLSMLAPPSYEGLALYFPTNKQVFGIQVAWLLSPCLGNWKV